MNNKCLKESDPPSKEALVNESRFIDQISDVQIDDLSHEAKEKIFDFSNRVAQSVLKKWEAITSPEISKKSLRDLLQMKQEEVMAVLFLDSKHRIISFEELFHWTIDSAMVYTRVLVKRALHHNSSAIILAHNHPSWVCEPSRADEAITERIGAAMSLIEVRLLDHFVVSTDWIYSFAEMWCLSQK